MDAIAERFGERSSDPTATGAQLDRAATSKSIQRRYLDPDEIAAMVAYLSSDAARSITGQAINVDGGAVLF